jgi:hypothetical protein
MMSYLFLDALSSSLSKYLAKRAHYMFPLMLSPGPIKSLISSFIGYEKGIALV